MTGRGKLPRATFDELPTYQPVTKEVQRNVGQVVPVHSQVYADSRAGGPRRPRFNRRAAICIDLAFPNDVELPVAIGADAHFGLGQFVPLTEALEQ